jgi:hypothetical protein
MSDAYKIKESILAVYKNDGAHVALFGDRSGKCKRAVAHGTNHGGARERYNEIMEKWLHPDANEAAT